MQITLINPQLKTWSPNVYPPLGLCYIAASLEQAGYEVDILDMNSQRVSDKALVRYIEQSPMVGIGGLVTEYREVVRLVKAIKEADENKVVVLGGPLATTHSEELLVASGADVAVIGEGEQTIVELARAIETGDTQELIKGIVYRDKDGVVVHPPREPEANLDSIPHPTRHLLDMGRYSTHHFKTFGIKVPEMKSTTIISSRGCPYHCLPKGTLILTSDMRQIPIEKMTVGDKIIGVARDRTSKRWKYVEGEVTRLFNRKSMVYAIETDAGTVYSTDEHPWLMHDSFLSIRDVYASIEHNGKVQSTRHTLRKLCNAVETPPETNDYKWGYLAGSSDGDRCFRYIKYNSKSEGVKYYDRYHLVGDYEMLDTAFRYSTDLGVGLRKAKFNGGKTYYDCSRMLVCSDSAVAKAFKGRLESYTETPEFIRGYMAGMYDADGSWTGTIRISQKEGGKRDKIKRIWLTAGFKVVEEKAGLRLLGGKSEAVRFLAWCHPSVRSRIRNILGKQIWESSGIKNVRPVGEQEVYNLETTVDTFIADGFVSHNCSFCDRNTAGQKWRARSPEDIVSEMRELQTDYDIRGFVFNDDTFVVNRKRVLDFCSLLEKELPDAVWYCNGRVNLMDEKMIQAMARSGCVGLAYGIESGNQAILDSVHKQITLEQVEQITALTKKYGIHVTGYFMIGILGDTKQTIQETLDFAEKLDLNFYGFGITSPIPGTEMYAQAVEKGLVDKGKRLEDWSFHAQMNLTTDCTNEELEGFNEYAFKKFTIEKRWGKRYLWNWKLWWEGLRTLVFLARKRNVGELIKKITVLVFKR